MFERSLKENGVKCKVLEFSSISLLKKCVAQGLGVTVCPSWSVNSHCVRLKTLKWKREKTSVIMIKHVDKWCSPLISSFMKLVRENMAT